MSNETNKEILSSLIRIENKLSNISDIDTNLIMLMSSIDDLKKAIDNLSDSIPTN